MVSSNFVELEVDTDSVGCEVVGWNVVIRGKFSELFLGPLLIVVVKSHRFEVNFLFDEVHLKIIDFIGSLKNPLTAVQVHSKFLPYVIEVGLLELEIGSSETFQTAICLKKVWLELGAKIDHVRTERIKLVLFVRGYFVENFFGF